MTLTRNTVRVLVMLASTALLGIIWLQVLLFRKNMTLQEEAFRHNAVAALNETVQKLEEVDLRERFFTVQERVRVPRAGPVRRDSTVAFFFTSFNSSMSAHIENGTLRYDLPKREKVTVRIFDMMGRLDTVLVEATKEKGTHEITLPDNHPGGIRFLQVKTDSATSMMRWEGKTFTGYSVGGRDDSAQTLIMRVAETFKSKELPSLRARLRGGFVDSALTSSLDRNGIDIPFEFAVFDALGDSLVVGNTSMKAGEVNSFSVPLFAHDFSGRPASLTLRFPTYQSYLFREFLPELSLNVLFLIIIVFCFWYTIRTIVRQKEFAGRLTDFINNMTHEFKTPLSTIALASEALDRPAIARSQSKLKQYNKIIGEEYARMRGQVDKILDMAALEGGEVEFHRSPTDLHAMIVRATDPMSLQIAARRGTLTTNLRASEQTVSVDTLHMENVLRSLVDNAVKYSTGAPHITIETATIGPVLQVRVIDRGIGIPREYHARVFEKYFRVPTGNLHDVKGFGLGLSYVKLVVEAHGGSVRLESAPETGTIVELTLPLETV